jgi:hypothetical protein
MEVVDNRELGRFEIRLEDGAVAFTEYRVLANGAALFPHTVVPPQHEGKGVASALVRGALASVRERGLRVMPQCTFVASYMKRHAETHDLLDPAYAKLLGVA